LPVAGIIYIEEGIMKDDLEGLIRRWHPEVPDPSAFKREVWRRIEQRGTADSWIERFFAGLTQPKIASLAAALALLGGAVIGSAIAGSSGQASYLRSVNPYAQVVLK
jgi:hypothetical protein